jgi:5-formyltetrahydrofolate cyclo-ligase
MTSDGPGSLRGTGRAEPELSYCDACTGWGILPRLMKECCVPDLSDVPLIGEGGGKAAVRATMLAARRALSAEARAQAAARSQAELLSLVRAEQPAVIAGYVPMRTEPGGADLPEVLATALGPAGRLLLPVLRPDLDLDWRELRSQTIPVRRRGRECAGRQAMLGRLRGRECVGEADGPLLGVTAITGATLVVVPAVAVDRTGVRLGRGGGSYDRALSRIRPDALVVALLYDGELVDTLPAEVHDQRVAAVILPGSGMIRLPVR